MSFCYKLPACSNYFECGLWVWVVNVIACRQQQICHFHRFITVNRWIITNWLHANSRLIADWFSVIAVLSPSWRSCFEDGNLLQAVAELVPMFKGTLVIIYLLPQSPTTVLYFLISYIFFLLILKNTRTVFFVKWMHFPSVFTVNLECLVIIVCLSCAV